VTLAVVLATVEADEVLTVSVGRVGFRLRMRSGPRISGARIPFPREAITSNQCRTVLIDMLRSARQQAFP
jgi:hypothetical protein